VNVFKLLRSLFRSAPRARATASLERVRSGAALLVDVREPSEWHGGVAEGAVLLPLTDLTGARQAWRPFLAAHDGRELLVYCAAGGRSALAARILAAEGFAAANAGSLPEWSRAGWRIVPPPATPARKT
jgi:rhodanese-related sulfurtransferase